MMWRDRFEREHKPLFERRNIGTTIWSPLAGGFLAGKYNDGLIPEGSRAEIMYKTGGHLAKRADQYFGEQNKEKTLSVLRALGDLAKELGFTQAQLALAWSIATKDTSTAILGFSRVQQVDENLGAIILLEKWSKEIESKVGTILKNTPELEMNWRTW